MPGAINRSLAPLFVLFLLVLAAPAKAQYVDFAFALGEAEVPEDPFWVREQGIVSEIRLVPETLFASTQEVVSADGRRLLPEGAQLIPLATEMSIICNLEKTEDRDYRSGRNRVCLVDEDRDGQFDTYFERGVHGLAVQLRSKRDAIEAPSIAEVPAETIEGTPYLSLHYQRFVDDGNWFQAALDVSAGNATPDGSFIRFHVKVGGEQENDRVWLTPGCGSLMAQSFCTSGALPNEFSFWGMRLRILERNDEDLRFQILTGFDSRGFRMRD